MSVEYISPPIPKLYLIAAFDRFATPWTIYNLNSIEQYLYEDGYEDDEHYHEVWDLYQSYNDYCETHTKRRALALCDFFRRDLEEARQSNPNIVVPWLSDLDIKIIINFQIYQLYWDIHPEFSIRELFK